ncbi:MAG: murein transglycosylase A [Syntrophobacteraceae bacterium]
MSLRLFAVPLRHLPSIRVVIPALCMALIVGCPQQPPGEPPAKPVGFERVPADEIPSFEDDMEFQSLREAIERSIAFFNRIPSGRTYPLGETVVSVDLLKASVERFRDLLDANRLDTASIAENFYVYRVRNENPGSNSRGLVTGYYEPVLAGRLEENREYCYPLYAIPSDLITIDLASFDPKRFSEVHLVGRLNNNRLVPYYSRADIDGRKSLGNACCELAWLNNPLDAFFLHVQGSGVIKLPGGESRRVGYAGTNGRPYTSIGKLLLEKNVMKADEMSLQTIRAYLGAHPEIRDEILWQNESYVFFRWVDKGPVGSINVLLTAGRSIATDAKYHPRGALAFLETRKPLLDSGGQVAGWEPLHRWVLNQDTGGAIKGVGRVDLFCGTGDAGEMVAGRMKEPGKIYFLLKKDSTD